jgi:hypothetical protein
MTKGGTRDVAVIPVLSVIDVAFMSLGMGILEQRDRCNAEKYRQ